MSFDESNEKSVNAPVLSVTLPDGRRERHLLRGRETTIGRDPSNHIRLADHFVSHFHAKLVRSGDTLTVVDLGSANKTRVNGRPVVQKTVNYGDEIQFAGVNCCLVEPGQPPPHERRLPEEKENSLDGDKRRVQPESESAVGARAPISDEAKSKWKPPISKLYLSGGVLALFAIVAALATRVC